MPTWSEVQDYVRKKYELHEDTADQFKLVWELRGQRFQAITVTRFSALDREWTTQDIIRDREDRLMTWRQYSALVGVPLRTLHRLVDPASTVGPSALTRKKLERWLPPAA